MKKAFLGLGTIASIGVVIPMTISCGTKDEDVVKIETYKSIAAFKKEYENRTYVLEGNEGNVVKVSFNDFKNYSTRFYTELNFPFFGKNKVEKPPTQDDNVYVILLDMKKLFEERGSKKADETIKSFQKRFSEKKPDGVGVLLVVWKTSKGNVYSSADYSNIGGMSNANATDMQKKYKAKLSAIEKAIRS